MTGATTTTTHRARTRGAAAARSIHEAPAYRAAEAAYLLKLNASTVRAWCFGQDYRYRGSDRWFRAVIRPADPARRLLSFSNLCELHILGAMTRGHRVPLQRVRRALDYVRRRMGSARLILLDFGPLAKIVALRRHWPVLFSIGCGLALVLLSRLGGDSLYGTGYDQARAILQQQSDAPGAGFGILKLFANVASYWANIPGGLFSPALSVGAGLGHNLSLLLPAAPVSAVVLLGMAAYLSGVTQSPLTAAVISMELTSNQAMVIPILATCLLARATSGLVCRTPVYRTFANRVVEQYRQRLIDDAKVPDETATETKTTEASS
jgi:hypothetical protein